MLWAARAVTHGRGPQRSVSHEDGHVHCLLAPLEDFRVLPILVQVRISSASWPLHTSFAISRAAPTRGAAQPPQLPTTSVVTPWVILLAAPGSMRGSLPCLPHSSCAARVAPAAPRILLGACHSCT